MTQPSSPSQQQQPPPNVAVQIAAALAASVTVAQAMALLSSLLAYLHLRRAALAAALAIVMAFPPDRHGSMGPASRIAEVTNLVRQAEFVAAAAGRINTAISRAESMGDSRQEAFERQITAERWYYAQHLAAIWNRARAATQVDVMSMTYGRLLGWYTVRDNRTSPECLAADRHNFYADAVPVIGYPGAVHTHCRCRPGRPIRGAALLPSLMQTARQPVYA